MKWKEEMQTFTRWNLTFHLPEWWLNGGWKATELWQERWMLIAFHLIFSHNSVDKIAGIFHWPFSLWKIKLDQHSLNLGYKNHNGNTLTTQQRAPPFRLMDTVQSTRIPYYTAFPRRCYNPSRVAPPRGFIAGRSAVDYLLGKLPVQWSKLQSSIVIF